MFNVIGDEKAGEMKLPNGFTLYWSQNADKMRIYKSTEQNFDAVVWDPRLQPQSTVLCAMTIESFFIEQGKTQ